MSGKIVIVGAGIAGLTAGYRLAQAGRDVLVIEREAVVGGLARSFRYDDFVFDAGPHRFHTELPEVSGFIREILGDDCLEIERRSGVWMFGRYFEWPLTVRSVLGMPFATLFRTGLDLLGGERGPCRNFEEYIVSRYGRTLHEIFFRPYTEKFLGISCSEISGDWAVTGIERAVIDKKIDSGDLRSFARSLLTSRPEMQFLYPGQNGIGGFADRLACGIEAFGGEVCTATEVEQITLGNGKVASVVSHGRSVPCDLLVWTAPAAALLSLLGRESPDLDFLPLQLFNYEIEGNPLVDYQWCYYGDAQVPFNRVSIPSRFNPALAPPGKTGVCVEVTGPTLARNSPEALDRLIRNGLTAVGLVESTDIIGDVHMEKLTDAYPIYRLDYREKYARAADMVAEVGNIELLGRTATFWYNNMDHSIEASLRLCARLGHEGRRG